jgi:hypothetical protein
VEAISARQAKRKKCKNKNGRDIYYIGNIPPQIPLEFSRKDIVPSGIGPVGLLKKSTLFLVPTKSQGK